MSRNRNFNQERNPLQMVIYIAAVIALLAGIVFLIRYSGKQNRAVQEEVQRLKASETEMNLLELSPMTETESETETAAPEESETEGETAALFREVTKRSILVLNGTRMPGVAGIWKANMEKAGYTNVHTATYVPDAPEETVIYTESKELEEALKELFPEAAFRSGKVETGIEETEGDLLPEKVDAYIVVGKKDAAARQ